ncbi:MAG: hypothetical protein OXH39_11165 [Candidatus Poribacteria bacterium]|nr:hypothetical protein [Candidatus Poribacteria bacterium]
MNLIEDFEACDCAAFSELGAGMFNIIEGHIFANYAPFVYMYCVFNVKGTNKQRKGWLKKVFDFPRTLHQLYIFEADADLEVIIQIAGWS